jgi:acyl carrier protein
MRHSYNKASRARQVIQQGRHDRDCLEFEESGAMNKLTNGAELQSGALTAEELELAQLIVSALNLEVQAEDINPEAPLYGEGLGLDSIDILELALAVSRAYGIKLRSDDENNRKIFSSLRSLNQHIRQRR